MKKVVLSLIFSVALVFGGVTIFAQEVETLPVEVVEEPIVIDEEISEELPEEDVPSNPSQTITSCEDIVTTTDLTIYLGLYGTVDFECFSQAVVEVVNQPVILFPGDKVEDYIQISIDGDVKPLSQVNGFLNYIVEEAGIGQVTVLTPHNLPNWGGGENEAFQQHTPEVSFSFYNTCEEIFSAPMPILTLYLSRFNEGSLTCVTESSQLNYTTEVTMPQGGDLIDYIEIFIDEDSIDSSELSAFVIIDENFSTDTPGQFTVQVAMAHPDTSAILANFEVTIEPVEITNARISPILECVAPQEDGTYIAYFGYENFNTVAIDILAGNANRITGGGLTGVDQGQVTRFLYPAPNHPEGRPGRTGFYPNFAFNVPFNGSNLVWTLTGPDGSTRTSTASANSTQCPVVEIPDDTEGDTETENDTTTGGGGGGSSSSSGSGIFTGGNTGGQVLGLFDDASNTVSTGEVLGASDISCPVFSNYLRRGNTGADVRVMQTFLNDHMQAGLVVDGIFGPLTEQAVRGFQAKYWDQIIAPWGSLARPNTTGRWYMTTRAWAHELLGCREDMKTLSNGVQFSTANFIAQ